MSKENATRQAAPELVVSEWFNSVPLTLSELRGKVVVIHAFQMLCPGCVLHGTPLAQRLHETLGKTGVVVIGLHTVFEHHQAMTAVSLAAYLHEFRITMPVAIDAASIETTLPQTMQAYEMRGTPTLIIIDRQGRIVEHLFGTVNELALGIRLGQLLAEE